MFFILIFILGLFVGSFLNVIIDRTGKNESFISGRSHCEFCNKKLKWVDLIPLLSYFFLKGKCRYCNKKLSYQYPIIEIITGILFLISFIYAINIYSLPSISFIFMLLFSIIVSCSLLLVFMIDLKFGIIPDRIIFFSVVVTAIYLLFAGGFLHNLLTAIASCAFFLLLVVITKGRGMGVGDAKFAFLIGLLLGFPFTIISIYLAFLTGAIVSIILILAGKKKFKKDTIPFGPFLAICTLLVFFIGNKLLEILLKVLNFG